MGKMLSRPLQISGLSLFLCFIASVTEAADTTPFADIHLHYNWSQVQNVTPEQAVQRLRDNHVVLASVSSSPPELALELARHGNGMIIPFFQPYLDGEGGDFWFRDQRVLPGTRAALQSGLYKGIGEIHLVPGIGASPRNETVIGLLRLAREFDVPVLIHTEASSHLYFQPVCQGNPQVRFLWAHAGGLLTPEQVGQLLDSCSNVWVDLSARDDWRYIRTPIVDENGHLLADWVTLLERYPDRFMVGSDPVWPVEDRNSWHTDDTGWDRLAEYINFHRRWLAALPAELARKVRLENARLFFGVTLSK